MNKPTEKAPKVVKPAVPAAKRISEQLKKSVVAGKLNKEELEGIAALAKSLTVFIEA
jgi:hypothetical protein